MLSYLKKSHPQKSTEPTRLFIWSVKKSWAGGKKGWALAKVAGQKMKPVLKSLPPKIARACKASRAAISQVAALLQRQRVKVLAK